VSSTADSGGGAGGSGSTINTSFASLLSGVGGGVTSAAGAGEGGVLSVGGGGSWGKGFHFEFFRTRGFSGVLLPEEEGEAGFDAGFEDEEVMEVEVDTGVSFLARGVNRRGAGRRGVSALGTSFVDSGFGCCCCC